MPCNRLRYLAREIRNYSFHSTFCGSLRFSFSPVPSLQCRTSITIAWDARKSSKTGSTSLCQISTICSSTCDVKTSCTGKHKVCVWKKPKSCGFRSSDPRYDFKTKQVHQMNGQSSVESQLTALNSRTDSLETELYTMNNQIAELADMIRSLIEDSRNRKWGVVRSDDLTIILTWI